MAIEELSPDRVGLRLHVISLGAGLDAETLRELLGYKRVSSVYRLLNGEQPCSLQQMKLIARTAAGKGEWSGHSWRDLFFYLQGEKQLGFSWGPDGDDGAEITELPEPLDLRVKSVAA